MKLFFRVWTGLIVLLLLGSIVASAATVSETQIAALKAKAASGQKFSDADIALAKRINATTSSRIDVNEALIYAKKRMEGSNDNPRPPHNPLDDYMPLPTTYSWVDISGDGQPTNVSGDDANGGPFDIGFDFPFYGENYSSVRVCSNGWLSFTSTDVTYWHTGHIPMVSLPNNVVYGWWDDLYVDPSAGWIKYRYDTAPQERFIVSWHCRRLGGSTTYDFQIILYPNGNIVMQYQTLAETSANLICGIENLDGTSALELCNGGTGEWCPAAESAILIAQPDGVPNPVTNLTGTYTAPNVVLNWTDPTQDTNGNPITPDSVLIYLGGSNPEQQIGHVASGVQTWTHINAPQGNSTYYVRAKNDTLIGGAASVNVVVGNPSYQNTFDVDDGAWVADNAVWAHGAPTNPNGPQAHSDPNVWSSGLASDYELGACGHLDLNLGLAITSPTATVEFWAWWDIESTWDGCNFKVSTDDGATWQLVTPQGGYDGTTNGEWGCSDTEEAWMGSHTNWEYIVLPIGEFVNQTPIFRFTFGSDPIINYAGFFFDDMTIWGMAPRPDGIPNPVTDLAGTSNGTTTVTLTWTDPTQDTNGNPLTPDSVLIFRGNAQQGSQIGHIAGGAQTFVVANEPQGNAVYCVRAKSTTYTSVARCVPVVVGAPTYVQNFDTDDGAWVSETGVWQWGSPTNPQGPQPHSGTSVWSTGLSGNYNNSVCDHLDLNLGLEVVSPSATVEFWAWWNLESSWDGCNFKVSVDGGNTWQLITPLSDYNGTTNGQWACGGQEQAWMGQHTSWTYIVLPIGEFVNQTPIFRFTFGSDASVTYPGFFFDDMTIWGLHPAQSAPVSGTISLSGGNGDVTQVLVTSDGLGAPSAHPASDGTFTMPGVQVGHRRLTATLNNYLTDTLSIVLDSVGYTGANITLRRVPPVAPTNFVGTVQTAERKDSLHWAVSADALVDGYKVYRKLSTQQTYTYRRTVWGRTTQWVKDTLEADGVYNFVLTAVDTNMLALPWSESAYCDSIVQPFGHLSPLNLTADGNFDSQIVLNWNPPSTFTESYLRYDNGMNDVDGIGWWGGNPSYGWITAHYQSEHPLTVTGVRAFLTQNATQGSPLQVGVFADNGMGVPNLTPLAVVNAVVAGPLGAMHEWTLDAPVEIENGSFFVGIRQMSEHPICLGAENATPFINNTFFYSFDGASWNTWEPNLLSVPMLSAHVIGRVNGAPAEAPLAVRRLMPATGFLTKTLAVSKVLSSPAASKSVAQTPSVSSGKVTFPVIPQESGTQHLYTGWLAEERLRSSVAPHAPIVTATQSASHGGGGRSLDDIIRYVVYRADATDSIGWTTPTVFTFTNTNRPENQPFTYTIKARYDDGQLSPPSNAVTVSCNMAPGAPANVLATAVGQTQMRITWADPTINADNSACVDLAGLRIYRDGTLISATPVAPGVQLYTDTPPDPMQVYTWSVKAIDEVPNEGAPGTASGSVLSPWHTVELNWVDITSNGTPAAQCDDCMDGPFDIGFEFPYYGATYNSLRVGSNGYITFNDATVTLYPSCPPNPFTPNGAVYGFTTDLLPSSGQCRYYADAANHRFIISWDNVPHWPSGPNYNFQIILDDNGGITMNYGDMGNTSGVVGVENADGTDGVALWCTNTGPFTPGNNAVQFWGGPRQAIEGMVRHLGGANPPLANAQVWVTGGIDTILTDTEGNYTLPIDSAGFYTVNFRHATHCDSIRTGVEVQENVNTTLNVSMRAPNATLNVTSLTFVVHRFLTQPQTFTITNNGGNCPLHYQVLDSVVWLSSDPASGSVNPGEATTITVTAAPGQMPIGEYHTTMRVVGDAPGTPFLLQVDMNVLTVDPGEPGLPTEFALRGNYPNPFNPTTVLPFDLPQQSQVDLIVYNVMGQEVARPVSGVYAAGRYNATFDAAGLPSGLYLVKMTAGHYTGMRKIMLLK